MKATTWAVLGSIAVNLVLGFLIALVFSVAPTVQADEMAGGPAQAPLVAAPDPQPPHQGGYLVAVRMGWEAS
jgi:hypothetical protein